MNVDLARAARDGDDDAFALLIRAHLPTLRAVAIGTLGYTGDADDVVQDAVLTAWRRIGDLRDPAAAGPWLRAIVRNNCRMLQRAARPLPVAEPEPLLPADTAFDPDTHLDRAATRDWVHHAVASLPGPVREVVVLRHFTDFNSYRQIAELCAVPEHTVRSRLRDGRRTLARALRDAASKAHADADATDAASRDEATATLEAGLAGDYGRIVRDRFHTDARVTVGGTLTGDRSMLVPMMDHTYGAGVRTVLGDTTASRDVMIWETRFVNPPDDPRHCPPAAVWLHTLRDGRTARLRLAYRDRDPGHRTTGAAHASGS